MEMNPFSQTGGFGGTGRVLDYAPKLLEGTAELSASDRG